MHSYNSERADRCAEILSIARAGAKLSRRELSELIGVSESTVKAWESGQGSPSLPTVVKWFKECGVNPFRSMLDLLWPETFKGLTAKNTDGEILKAVVTYVRDVASAAEIRKLHHLFSQNTNRRNIPTLDIACAYAHMSISDRYRIADIIEYSYSLFIEKKCDSDNLSTDRAAFLVALDAAQDAVAKKKGSYTLLGKFTSDFEICPKILYKSRTDKGFSRRDMAKALGKTERTIKNWEENHPTSILEMCSWFNALDVSMWPYLRNAIIPNEPIGFSENETKAKNDIINYINRLKPADVRKLCFLLLGNYGSSWFSVLEMFNEFTYLEADKQAVILRLILASYYIAEHEGRLYGKDHIMPDMEYIAKNLQKDASTLLR